MIAALRRIARSQAIVLRNVLRGWPVVYTGPTSMTIDEDDLALADSLLQDRSRWADLSPIADFEGAFGAWNGSRGAVSYVSGRVAIRAAVDALGLQPGDEIIVPGYTCVVVANALHAAGLRPVYADIELETFGLDKDGLRSSITPRTRAVILQHLYGLVSRDLVATCDQARAHGLSIIEDCAQATGASQNGRRVGNFGDVGIFSADPSKPFNCVQGGVAVSNDPRIVERLFAIQQGMSFHDEATTANRLRNMALARAEMSTPQYVASGKVWW